MRARWCGVSGYDLGVHAAREASSGTAARSVTPVLLPVASRSTTGEGFHGVLDTANVVLHLLHVQPSSRNLIISDIEKRHPSHLERLPVSSGARPAPFAPDRVTVLDRPTDLGAEVGDPGKHGRPVGAHLSPPNEGSAGVRRLLAAVILVEETGDGIEIMSVHRHNQSINYISHRVPRAREPLRHRASPWSPPLRRESRARDGQQTHPAHTKPLTGQTDRRDQTVTSGAHRSIRWRWEIWFGVL